MKLCWDNIDNFTFTKRGLLRFNRVSYHIKECLYCEDNFLGGKNRKYCCRKCGSEEALHCHHMEGIRWNPLESADMDACITVCQQCHKEIHQKDGCNYHEMKCNRGVI